MDGISKAVLYNPEWSHIIKHNIFCLHRILVYHSLSIVLTAIPLFDANIRFLITVSGKNPLPYNSRVTYINVIKKAIMGKNYGKTSLTAMI